MELVGLEILRTTAPVTTNTNMGLDYCTAWSGKLFRNKQILRFTSVILILLDTLSVIRLRNALVKLYWIALMLGTL
jgi:hypothetical protein